MLKLLLKKQLTEIFRNYFYNPKKNRARSKAGIIGYILLFVIIMVISIIQLRGQKKWVNYS